MLFAICLSLAAASQPAEHPLQPGSCAEYTVLTARAGEKPPFAAVTLTIGPTRAVGGQPHVWWRLDVHPAEGQPAMVRIEALTTPGPINAEPPSSFARYRLHIPETGETLEYQHVHTRRALLPPWERFAEQFMPRSTDQAGRTSGFPRTCRYLGHVLSLRRVSQREWQPLDQARVLSLDPELLVGTARNFKDTEGRRLEDAKTRDYTYTPFTAPDYRVMLGAGINLYCVTIDQEPFVRGEPVFYLRRPEKKRPRLPIRYPADLYRSNFLGTQMFLDEPAVILTLDEEVNRRIRHASDAVGLIASRIRAAGEAAHSFGRQIGDTYNLGELTLVNHDYPVWEVLDYTAFYQLEAGLAGFVHEGRYRLENFDERIARQTGTRRTHTADELLRYHYALQRGAARSFGKFWGTSIYGQVDPAIAPRALTLAYDLGARYLWFWTSDHEFHLPWNEQVRLAQALRDHAAAHPRGSISGPAPALDLAIVLPYGHLLSLDELNWVRELSRRSGDADARARYDRIQQRAYQAIDQALADKLDFDILIDNGREITGYRKVLRISAEE